jgi:hypothetical protein
VKQLRTHQIAGILNDKISCDEEFYTFWLALRDNANKCACAGWLGTKSPFVKPVTDKLIFYDKFSYDKFHLLVCMAIFSLGVFSHNPYTLNIYAWDDHLVIHIHHVIVCTRDCTYTPRYCMDALSSAEAYMKFLVREKWARKEWWEELNKGSLCELMQSIWRRI